MLTLSGLLPRFSRSILFSMPPCYFPAPAHQNAQRSLLPTAFTFEPRMTDCRHNVFAAASILA